MYHFNIIDDLTFYKGRVALYALLKSLDLGHNDNVALQAFTCSAVPEAIIASGAYPIFIDIAIDSFNIQSNDLEKKLTPQTRAIIVQHTFGIPANMDRIKDIAANHNIPIIEDCCHSLTSTYKNQRVGSFGIGSFYSFEWGKPLVSGIGGGVQINDEEIRNKIRNEYKNYRLPGIISRTKIELQYQAFKFLYRPFLYWPIREMFHFLGSIGIAESNYNPLGQGMIADDFKLCMAPSVKRRLQKKLNELVSLTINSQWIAKQYRERIHSKAVSHPVIQDNCNTVFARYPLLSKNKHELLSKARQAHIELANWYSTPVHPLQGQELESVHYKMNSCPNAESRCREIVSLPVHSRVTQRDIDRTISFLNNMDT